MESPRFIGHVFHRDFGPLQRFSFARFLLGHLLVSDFQIVTQLPRFTSPLRTE